MALSVIVTSYESPVTLRECLLSLSEQVDPREIVVSDCSPLHPASSLQAEFPAVRFLQFDEPRSVPELRWSALPFVTGDIIAAVEARCVPSATWCAELLAAHAAAPLSPAVGGPVTIAGGASNFDWALYLCEYGAFAPPLPPGPARAISGANLSYKRLLLDSCADLTQRGAWETLIHERWHRENKSLTLCGASVSFVNSMSIPTALAQRWHYGRGYAADRVAAGPWPMRWLFGLAAPLLPFLMTLRLARAAAQKGLLMRFLRAFGWTLALNTRWSLGEMVGYLTGKPGEAKIF